MKENLEEVGLYSTENEQNIKCCGISEILVQEPSVIYTSLVKHLFCRSLTLLTGKNVEN